MIDHTQRRAGRVAGVTLVLTYPIVVAIEFGITRRVLVPGSASATAAWVLANERVLRLAIVANLVNAAGLIVLLSALYVVLRPVSRGVALLAAAWRLAYAGAWALMMLDFLRALRLLSDPEFARGLGSGGVQSLAYLYLNGYEQYYLGLLFWALASAACAWLWFRSGYVPAALPAFGLVASAWCVVCTLLLYVFPDFPSVASLWWFDTPMGLFEVVLGIWLLVRGLADRGAATTTEPRPPAAVTS